MVAHERSQAAPPYLDEHYLRSLTNKALNRKVTLTENGKTRRVPLHEYLAKVWVQAALKGDLDAVRFILGRIKYFPSPKMVTPRRPTMSDAEFERMTERLAAAAGAYHECQDYQKHHGVLSEEVLEQQRLPLPETWGEFIERED